MRWHIMFNHFSDLSPDNKQSVRTANQNISLQTFNEVHICWTMRHQRARDSLLLWTWILHDTSGHIRDFFFPSCQNNLTVYERVAAFISGFIDKCRSSTNSHFISAIWTQLQKVIVSTTTKYTYTFIDEWSVTSTKKRMSYKQGCKM